MNPNLLNPKNLVIIGLVIVVFIFYIKSGSDKRDLRKIKKELIENDSLVKVRDGAYTKLVDDLNSERDIKNSLEKSNKELYDSLMDIKANPIIHTKVEIKWKTKRDTVLVNSVDSTFTLTYPDKVDPFISYTGQYKNDMVIGEWDFKPIKLDLVISETENNIFRADLAGNEWLEVNSIEVKSLELENVRPDNFDWKAGAGIFTSPDTPYGIDFYGGARIKKLDILLRIQPNGDKSQLGAGLIFNF